MAPINPGLTLISAAVSMLNKLAPAQVELESLPGHNIRRLHQIAVAMFMQETQAHGLTPVQYAALHAVCAAPGIDQRTLARVIGFDTSTIGGVIDRHEARGLLQRNASATDRRVRLLTPTADGEMRHAAITPAMLQAQQRMLEPLKRSERAEFMRMLRVLVTADNEVGRAPSETN